MTEGFIVEIDC